MLKAAPVLVLLAALQVVTANNSPIVLDLVNSDTAKNVVRLSWEEMGDDSAFETLHESRLTAVQDDNSTSYVLRMPYFPMIIYLGGVSMSLIDISIEGLDLVVLPQLGDIRPDKGVIRIPIQAPSLSFNAGSYVAGGKILNLPFVGTGSSSAQIGLNNLSIVLSYEIESLVNFCPKVNSTNFYMTLNRLSMNFEDLNPGQDSGDLINAVLNSVTDDITKWLNILLNEPAGKDLLERLILWVLPFQCDSWYNNGDEQAADLAGLSGDKDSLTEFTHVLEKIVSLLSSRMEIQDEAETFLQEEAETFLELFGDLLSEIDLVDAAFIQ